MPNFNIIGLIKSFGYLGIGAIIFAESGLLLGFILPGDSLLFTAGLLASQGILDLATLLGVVFITAVLGDNAGFLIGRWLGRKVFEKNNFIFNQQNLRRTEEFYVQHGKTALLIQRFFPIVRAFAPLLAGVAKMRHRRFFVFDLAGCALWGFGVTILGYYLGRAIPNIDTYILPIALLIVLISLIPAFLEYMKRRRSARLANEKTA